MCLRRCYAKSANVILPLLRMIAKPVQLIVLLTTFLISFGVCASAQSNEKTQQAIGFFNQGQDAHEKGDLKAALELYDKAIEVIPDFPEAELQRGNALISLKRPEEAEKAFRRALEIREDWTLASHKR